jgi:hypothetical protein
MLSIITGRWAFRALLVYAGAGIGALSVSSCDRVPLLAPFDSTITLSANTAIVQTNGVAEIRATVIESAGTPVHDGTLVTFSTNLGVLSPTEARTVNGVATVQFVANGQSGEAQIRANSGAARPTEGQINGLSLKVGGAAAGRVTLNASPASLSASGGSSTITANVTDAVGNALSGVSVSFSTTDGSLSTTVATSDGSGNARTTLTTTREATVTATVGANMATVVITVVPRPTVTISSSGSPTVGGVATFTISATPAQGGAPLDTVTINFGDGSPIVSLGSGGTGIPAQHVYDDAGPFTVTVTARDTTGQVASASTPIVVIQPVIVGITTSKTPGTTDATFTAVVTPAGTQVATYTWSFGDGTVETVTSNPITHHYVANATYTVRLTVTTVNGQTASATSTVTIP